MMRASSSFSESLKVLRAKMVLCGEGRLRRVAEKEEQTTTPKGELQHQKRLVEDEEDELFKMRLLSYCYEVVRCCGGGCEGGGGARLARLTIASWC
jgi:hypothetical protein